MQALQLKSVTALISELALFYNHFIQNKEMLYLPIPMLQCFDQILCHISSSASTNARSAAYLARAWRETQPNKNPWMIHIFEPLKNLEKEKSLR